MSVTLQLQLVAFRLSLPTLDKATVLVVNRLCNSAQTTSPTTSVIDMSSSFTTSVISPLLTIL
ncbi:hypothetical protein TGAM01_v208541 [Trichoderma gamsii]|uniref:Uncharacterized protein n=1 Tax=Trichoderma gamsii TaxID=398673 RepID=A0A2P4ZED4_9HYPO|nr:hypothetical protein TGAM01_v208541 [Trichoderma gamsii]PON22652.1 hypothetical protein TGAM01_v208541 [Trichoderma gamsii]